MDYSLPVVVGSLSGLAMAREPLCLWGVGSVVSPSSTFLTYGTNSHDGI